MVFLFSIFAQYFSRGAFIQVFLNQERWEVLIGVLVVSMLVSSPIQGHMSDVTSRKRVIVPTLLVTIVSIILVMFAHNIEMLKLPIILGIAAVLNSVFGNVFPAAGAAYSESIEDQKKAIFHSLLARHLGLGIGYILPLPQTPKLIVGVCLAFTALVWVVIEVGNKKAVTAKE